jgi:hypothetical protein
MKVHPRVRPYLTKHFCQTLFPSLVLEVDSAENTPLTFWKNLPQNLKLQALCFILPSLIEFVNQVNSKLLYSDLLTQHKCADSDFQLLSSFELLWNLDRQALKLTG